MIAYSKSGLKIVEFHFSEAISVPERVDVVRYQSRFEKVTGTHAYEFHSIVSDLTLEPEELLKRMNATTRNQVRRALKNNEIQFEFFDNPSPELIDDFFTFYDKFALLTKLPAANRTRIRGMQECRSLALSRVVSNDGTTLVWHCYLKTENWTRLVHTASHFRGADKEQAALIARANRCHIYLDMVRFHEMGLATYDFGGWYSGKDDQAKLKVNTFKESFGGSVVRYFNTDHGATFKGVLAVHARRIAGNLRGQR